jgi:hypothetical protein
VVRSKGSRAWVLRYQMGGRHRDMGLGPYPEVALADPREKALDARRLLKRDGKASPTPRLWKTTVREEATPAAERVEGRMKYIEFMQLCPAEISPRPAARSPLSASLTTE